MGSVIVGCLCAAACLTVCPSVVVYLEWHWDGRIQCLPLVMADVSQCECDRRRANIHRLIMCVFLCVCMCVYAYVCVGECQGLCGSVCACVELYDFL